MLKKGTKREMLSSLFNKSNYYQKDIHDLDVLYTYSMSTPILATKLYAPPPRPDIVSRPRLIEKLRCRVCTISLLSSLPPPVLARPLWSANGLPVAVDRSPGCPWMREMATPPVS